MKRITIIIFLVLIGSMLAGCDGLLTTATPTPTATNIPLPTATATVTPMPTMTPTRGVVLTKFYESPVGGYSFELPADESPWAGLSVSVNFGETTINALSGELTSFITIGGRVDPSEFEELFIFFVGGSGLAVEDIDPDPFEVDGNEARRAISSIENGDMVFQRQLILINGDDVLIAILSDLNCDSTEECWEDRMAPIEDIMLDSFQINTPNWEGLTERCLVSEDSTYGYSIDNPIQVGGDELEGQERVIAYLDNLQGPNGESTSYELVQSIEHDGVVLDEYQITYEGLSSPITLFIDIYSWNTVTAPLGFICRSPFTLTQP